MVSVMSSVYLVLTILYACVSLVNSQTAGLFGVTQQGDGTYYTTTYGQGACSFAQGSVQYSPWLSGTQLIVAVNAPQYFGSQTCGMCLAYRGLGPGSGANPVSQFTQYAIVGDLCPECGVGALDQATYGDGRWTISWNPVQCNVGSSNFIYSFQGSNPYYLKMQVANTRVPPQSVSIMYNGAYVQMDRVSDNYFVAFSNGGGAFQLPTSLQITSILGDTVYDTLSTSTPSGNVPGGVQFPLSPQWDTVGGQSAPATNTPVTPPASVEEAQPPPAPVPVPSPPPASPPPAIRPPPPRASPPPPRATPAAARPPPPPKVATAKPPPPKAALVSSPPIKRAPPPPPRSNTTVQTSLSIQPYLQCGGKGAGCLGSQCVDAVYPSTTCGPNNYGVAFGCSRVNAYYWQCLPATLAQVQNAGFQAASSIQAPPSGRTESASACPVPIGNNLQCGGNGGYCSTDQNGTGCADQQWSDACCLTDGYNCLRFSASYWECRNTPFTT